jgi:hypothetical protein
MSIHFSLAVPDSCNDAGPLALLIATQYVSSNAIDIKSMLSESSSLGYYQEKKRKNQRDVGCKIAQKCISFGQQVFLT